MIDGAHHKMTRCNQLTDRNLNPPPQLQSNIEHTPDKHTPDKHTPDKHTPDKHNT